MKVILHKLLCLLGLHKMKHDYTVFTEATVTIVLRCEDCFHVDCKTSARISNT